MVRLPIAFPAVLSKTLGNVIADRLSTKDARRWRKTIDIERQQLFNASATGASHYTNDYPESYWPIHSIILSHTLKRNYGLNENIFWELKLIGDDADHGFFIETILPAMEQLSCEVSKDRLSRMNVWGHFDIQNVWIANGNSWESLITDGNLNLRYHPHPLQWNSHFSEQTYHRGMLEQKKLVFLTPFEFEHQNLGHINDQFVPGMSQILESLIRRWIYYTSYRIQKDIWDLVPSSILVEVKQALETACNMRIDSYQITPALNDEPGSWKGELTYNKIPFFLLPYLDMAAILHVGNKTHYGCGTFTMC